MNKRSIEASNTVCPQTTFLLGTYKEDGRPNFGLFCWITYCWDGQLNAVVSIGGGKLTKDRIQVTGVFSANLVSESMLPLADYLGNNSGYDAGKMDIECACVPGAVLPVPVLADSPWSYELEVKQTIELDGGTVFICAIRNVLADEALLADSMTMAEKIAAAHPVLCMPDVYFSVGQQLGSWGQWKNLRKK
jgi:flavin reductase (DIM6/NTAB) family NADH-FMN oxidoreductase RutF